jgi:hypothetical protein
VSRCHAGTSQVRLIDVRRRRDLVERRVDGAKAAVADRMEEERELNKMFVALDALGPPFRPSRSCSRGSGRHCWRVRNESALRALLVGTPMAMIDRARDLLREALPGRRGGDGTHAPSS